MDAIVINGLTKTYGGLTVVDSLNLAVRKGEIFGLLGPNGAGKTTTLMMLSTLLKPSAGSAAVTGFDVVREPGKVRSSIGMVFQDPSSDEVLSGYENLKLHALMYDVPSDRIDRKIDDVLDLVELKDRKNDVVKKYSGGMRRRLELARGLLHEPEVLFLDEPTLGLDPQTREHIWEYIEDLARKLGMTVIVTTHYMEEADKLCDRVAIIDEGKIVALDAPEALKKSLGGDRVLISGRSLKLDDLAKLPYVTKVEPLDGGRARLTIADAGRNLQELLRVTGELDLVEVHPSDLNDVFLHFTGRQIREEAGGVMEQLRVMTQARQNDRH